MKYDIILAGVGGQGVLSVGAIIALAAMESGYQVKQSEVHGMAQRGGAVLANLRISDAGIAADLIARGTAAMILSMEPVESLRYVEFLSPDGILITSKDSVENITDYPDINVVFDKIRTLPAYKMVESRSLAREAGSMLATNMVMVGAASKSLPIEESALEDAIKGVFGRKGDHVVDVNHRAFRLGRKVE